MMVPRSFTLLSLLASVADAAFNVYQSVSDFPDGVDATSTCGNALNASVRTLIQAHNGKIKLIITLDCLRYLTRCSIGWRTARRSDPEHLMRVFVL